MQVYKRKQISFYKHKTILLYLLSPILTYMQPINILLIEGNAGDILLTTKALKEGHIAKFIAVANDALQAMDFLHKKAQFLEVFTPYLVLLNNPPPKLNRLEVLERIKEDDGLIDLPENIISTSSSRENIFKSNKQFADGFTTKPTNGNEFLEVIDYIKNFWQSKLEIFIKI